MKYSFNSNLGEGLCIFTSFHFPDSGLYLSNGFDFILIFFEWRDTENQQYNNCKIMRALGNGLSVQLSVLFQSPVTMGKKSKTIGHTLYLS